MVQAAPHAHRVEELEAILICADVDLVEAATALSRVIVEVITTETLGILQDLLNGHFGSGAEEATTNHFIVLDFEEELMLCHFFVVVGLGLILSSLLYYKGNAFI